MAKSNFKTWCRPIDYIEAQYPRVAELLHGTCADASLSARGKPGVTIIIPNDAVLDKIEKKAFSMKTEDANEACDMLNAYIFRNVFKTPAEWAAKKDELPNSLFPSQHVELESASGKEIVFKSGAKAVVDDGFRDASHKRNVAVWKLTAGEIPVTKDKNATTKYAARVPRKNKDGAYDVSPQIAENLRYRIGLIVENEYYFHLMQGAINAGRHRNAYLEYSCSLLNFIANVYVGGKEILYEFVLPIISFQHIDFYLLVEPHNFTGSHILSDELIDEWWRNREANPCNVQAVMKQMCEMLENAPAEHDALIYKDRMAILTAIDKQRDALAPLIDSKARQCVEEISRIYDDLSEKNSINGTTNVLPSGLSALYKSEKGLKLMQDELRYVTYIQFMTLEERPDTGQFREIIGMIGDYMNTFSADERARAAKLLNRNVLRSLITPTERVNEIKIFVNSTRFLFIPLTKANLDAYPRKTVMRKPESSNAIFNIDKALLISHKRLFQDLAEDSSASTQAIIAALRKMEPGKIPRDLQDAINKLAVQ